MVKGIAIGSRGLGFDFRAGRIGLSVGSCSPSARRYRCVAQAQAVEMDTATHCTLSYFTRGTLCYKNLLFLSLKFFNLLLSKRVFLIRQNAVLEST